MDPIAVFSLPIRGRKKLKVFIWKHLKDLRRAAVSHSAESAHYWRHALGAYVGVITYSQSGRLEGFGEIHLWEKMIGAGYFAHELQHFMADYSTQTETYPLDQEANERMAWLAGELTARFWTKFYDRFDLQPGMKDA